MTSRYWCFTENNPTEEPEWRDSFQYLVYEGEMTDACTPHWQGYVQLKKARDMQYMSRWMPRARFSIQFGTNEQAANYCKKGDSAEDDSLCLQEYKEFGEFKPTSGQQGSRNDLYAFADAILVEGKSRSEVIREFPVVVLRYSRGMEVLFNEVEKGRCRQDVMNVHWYYGQAGSGKTRAVYDFINDDEQVWKAPHDIGSFWNQYNQQRAVLFDDFRSSRCKFSWLLELLDRYPVIINVKNASKKFKSEYLFITCNKSPEECYKFLDPDDEDIVQLLRRLTCVKHFTRRNPCVDVTSEYDKYKDEDYFSGRAIDPLDPNFLH